MNTNPSNIQEKSLAERDQAVVWHPFTQMKTAPAPIPIVRGEGALLFDEDGNTYIDAIASWWMNLHGHAHPFIAKRLYEQAMTLEHVIFANFTHHPAVNLAEKIVARLDQGQTRAFYSDNGSTSVEVGIKMCIQYWHNRGQAKTKMIALEEAYHGDTFGAMSVGARNGFSAPFNHFLFDVEFIPAPLPGDEERSLTALKSILKKGDVAGFIFEPLVQGSGGMRMYSPEVLDEMVSLCHDHDVLCIADEVMVGFYRTGKFFACDHLENKPDIYCLSKGLTGGTTALGMTTCTEEVYRAFYADDKMKTLFHGHSCTANPMACTVGLASLELLEADKCQADIQRIINAHRNFQLELKASSIVKNVRQTGVILAFDVDNGESTSYFNSIRDRMWNFCMDQGVILRPLGNTLYVLPPYVITEEQLEKVYQTIRDLLVHLSEGNSVS